MRSRLLLVLSVLSIIYSCDKVEGPYRETGPTGPVGVTGPTGSDSVRVRKVLLEDYTGHLCGNCPEAATALKNIVHDFEGKVIPVAIHAGYFARLVSPNYNYDFRSSSGTELDNFFGISNAGNPNGMVNRSGYTSSGHIVAYTAWRDSVTAKLLRPADASISITLTYDPSSRQLNTTTNVEALKDFSEELKLSLILVEDSIITYQKDYTATPEDIPNYVFMHTYRAAINTTWGEVLNPGSTMVKDQILSKSNTYTIPSTFDDRQCHVVAFIYKSGTYEVLQAEMKKIR